MEVHYSQNSFRFQEVSLKREIESKVILLFRPGTVNSPWRGGAFLTFREEQREIRGEMGSNSHGQGAKERKDLPREFPVKWKYLSFAWNVILH